MTSMGHDQSGNSPAGVPSMVGVATYTYLYTNGIPDDSPLEWYQRCREMAATAQNHSQNSAKYISPMRRPWRQFDRSFGVVLPFTACCARPGGSPPELRFFFVQGFRSWKIGCRKISGIAVPFQIQIGAGSEVARSRVYPDYLDFM